MKAQSVFKFKDIIEEIFRIELIKEPSRKKELRWRRFSQTAGRALKGPTLDEFGIKRIGRRDLVL